MANGRTITVEMLHGDLRHARYPLAVGHYEGDVIVNAEAAIDAALGGALRHRFDLGIYPGAIGTSDFVAGVRPPGAIVVGLGAVGDLSAASLRLTFATALRRYAIAAAEDDSRDSMTLGVSSLLLGTDGTAVGTLADSIHAIIRGTLDANRSLAQANLSKPVRFATVQFVELYEDVAVRAAHVLHKLPGPLARELEPEEAIVGAPRLTTCPGGRWFRPGDPYESGWWQRIAVRRKQPVENDASAPSTDATMPLQFTVLTDRARLEQETSIGQRALIQQLLATATGRTDLDLELSAALYQLVVPPQVKDRIHRGGNLVFMVDRLGASYPYELMAEQTAMGPRPLTAERSMLRQFETEQFRIQPEMARADRIFIVGNPKTVLFDDLPGAQLEADEVEALAYTRSLAVERAPRQDAERTVIKLMTGEFRILHFAAHGQFDPEPMKSGVVIGDRLRITPSEVAHLALVPELVFLNCCYLGNMGQPRASAPDPRLAASLAEGFIQAGVRAVIASGWAVNDAAGRTFACTFYEHFLDGDAFGESVKAARIATFTQHPKFNTWGAFQCYGNPDYRFRRTDRSGPPARAPHFVARSEALQALRTLASNARAMHLGDEKRLQQEFDDLRKYTAEWCKEGEVLACYGQISAELEQFETAIDFYQRALESVPATAAVLIVEQLANLLTRSAANRVALGTPVHKVMSDFDTASGWLDWLDTKLAPSKERAALWGALYKRRALYDTGDRVKHLARAEEAYLKAAELAGKDPYEDPYQRLNAVALRFVRAPRSDLPKLRTLIDACVSALRRTLSGDRDFWGVVAEPDTWLHHHIIYETLATNEARAATIEGYKRARLVGPSLREWASVRDHVAFLQGMLADASLACSNPATAKALEAVVESMAR